MTDERAKYGNASGKRMSKGRDENPLCMFQDAGGKGF